MNPRVRGSRPVSGESRRGLAFADAVAAAGRLEAGGHDRPVVLAVHPVATTNPYQALLYRTAWPAGVAPIGLHDLADLDELRPLPGLGVRTVLHLHWTNKILEGALDEAAGRAAIAAFVERLDRFLGSGGRLAWTVHNEVPHDARLPALETELQAAIVERAAIVHVMSPATLDATAATFPIPPDRALLVPHPSYAGVYPDLIGRDQARHRLGLDPDAVVYGLFGAIKPYKGLAQILDAFDALVAADPRGSPPRRLLVAGAPDRSPGTKAFLERARLHPLVSRDTRRIPTDELAGHLRATDVAVLPYQRGLNSGVLLLALTFGLPVVVPDLAAFDDIAVDAVARRFRAGDAASLSDGLRSADELLTPSDLAGAREAAARIVGERDPEAISRRFIAGLLERLG